MCKYSFLLPAFKAKYLNQMLESLQAQTFKNFKVIISDDCSPEDIQSICSPYLADSRFIYRRTERNLGGRNLVSHWNLLLDLCDTEYFIMASDDDVYDRKFLEEIDRLTIQFPDFDLLRARTRRINDTGEPYEHEQIFEQKENLLQFVYSSFCQDRIHCIGNYVFKTQFLKSGEKFIDFPLAWFSDDATVFSCALNCVANTNDILFSFRNSNDNISNEKKKSKKVSKMKVEATCLFYEWMHSFINNMSFPKTLYNHRLYNDICYRYKYRVQSQINSYYYQLDLNSLKKLIKWMKGNKLLSSQKATRHFISLWIKYKINKMLCVWYDYLRGK